MYKRILLKISGEALSGKTKNFDDSVIEKVVNEISELCAIGVQVGIVVGGGNFWRGRDTKEGMNRSRSDQIGMLATIMNGIYLSEAFVQNGIQSIVMTPFKAHNFTEYFEKQRALEALKEGKVLIFSGGAGLPYFSTDTITAIRACELEADAILFAKNGTDGIYNKDPNKNKDAKKYKEISYGDIIKQNLGVVDISAISICREGKIEGIAFDFAVENSIITAVKGGEELYKIGTKITF